MPSHWETGVVVNKPTWHRLEHAVLPDYITDWETGLKEAHIDWEIYTDEVFTRPRHKTDNPEWPNEGPQLVENWQAIRRDDSHKVLSIQPTSLAVIPIKQFGEVVETVAGEGLKYEAIFSLYGGKMIVALLYFEEGLEIPADAGISQTLQYLCMQQRFDGQGGLRGLPTSVRTICANTVNLAEAMDTKGYGFNIRHTSNWEERVEDARLAIQTARRDGQAWAQLANRLSLHPVTGRTREAYLKKFIPIASDMTDRQVSSAERAREGIRMLLQSTTNEHIAGNAYGLVTASTEWADHVRRANSDETAAARQLVRKEPLKARSIRIASEMAGIKRSELLKAVSE